MVVSSVFIWRAVVGNRKAKLKKKQKLEKRWARMRANEPWNKAVANEQRLKLRREKNAAEINHEMAAQDAHLQSILREQ
jgi:hypothetical protein